LPEARRLSTLTIPAQVVVMILEYVKIGIITGNWNTI